MSQQRTSRVKSVVALVATGLAVSALYVPPPMPLEPEEVLMYGHNESLPPAVMQVFSQVLPTEPRRFTATAMLVDAERGLFLTAFHVPEGEFAVFIRLPDGSTYAPVVRRWGDSSVDLAIVQIIDPGVVQGIQPLVIASGPPMNGQALVVRGYHRLRDDPRNARLRIFGFSRPFTVLRAATDSCVSEETCRWRDFLRRRQISGIPLDPFSQQSLYPNNIYVLGTDDTVLYGLVPGLSGSPTMGEDGFVYGVVSSMFEFDLAGKHGMFAPAYVARALIQRAQTDIAGTQLR